MFTITRLIDYRATTVGTKATAPDLSLLTSRERENVLQKLRRFRAKAKGYCGECVTRRCNPGEKTCPSCTGNKKKYRKRRS